MGKRSNFKRIERDFYPTPKEAIYPLLPFVEGFSFYEPCAGNGQLSDFLCEEGLFCVGESDIEPQRKRVVKKDIFDLTKKDIEESKVLITNPPWDRKILHSIIEHCMSLDKSTWLLFDSDWPHTKQSINYVKKYLTDIVSIGRLKWIPDSKMTGKDNCCWYRFSANKYEDTRFYGRK